MTELTGEALDDMLSGIFSEAGEMLTRWVLAAEVIQEDGERVIWTVASPDLRAWDSMGMLSYALQRENARVGRADEDDE